MTSEIVSHPVPLTQASQIENLASKLKDEPLIGYDTEFIRETTFFPKLELIQVATAKESWLVDFQAFEKRCDKDVDKLQKELAPLIDVFLDPKILKIVHAAQGDQECLFTSLAILAEPILDTAVAAALCGYGEGIGLAALMKAVLDFKLKKGHARTNWTQRPLPQQLIEYAHADVTHLVILAEDLLKELEKLGRRDWALELSAFYSDPETFTSDPAEMAEKLARGGKLDDKNYAVLIEIVKWREKKIREFDIPRRRLADDGTLLDIARVCPKDSEHLQAFRGLNKRDFKNTSREILEAIDRGFQVAQSETAPKLRRSEGSGAASNAENRAVTLLRCYVGLLSDKHQIAGKFLVGTDELLRLVRARATTVAELTQKKILTPSAAKIIGPDLLQILSGNLALTLRGKEVEIVPVAKTEQGNK